MAIAPTHLPEQASYGTHAASLDRRLITSSDGSWIDLVTNSYMVAFDLRRLRMLRELDERGTLAAVAIALGYTPSAISQQLSVLEKEVGVRLLQKAGRGVRLTDAGRLLSRHAGVLLDAADDARVDLASLTGELRGTVRAGGLESAPAASSSPPSHACGPTTRTYGWRSPSSSSNRRCPSSASAHSTWSSATSTTATHDPGRPASPSNRCRGAARLVLPAAHPCAKHGGPVAMTALQGGCLGRVGHRHRPSRPRRRHLPAPSAVTT